MVLTGGNDAYMSVSVGYREDSRCRFSDWTSISISLEVWFTTLASVTRAIGTYDS